MSESSGKKISVKSAAIVVLMGIFVLAAIVVCHKFTDYSGAVQKNWDFVIPAKAGYREIYKKDGRSGAQGSGQCFHVFAYRYQKHIDGMLDWSAEEERTLFSAGRAEAAESWLDALEVPSSSRPDYAACLGWYKVREDSSEILVFSDPELRRLYILESFS